jgi:S1-C subfamily serine protease
MKKRILSILLATAAVLSLSLTTARAGYGSMGNFKPAYTYTSGQFRDVRAASWYSMYIQANIEYGLLGGRHEGIFAPAEALTTAEAIKIAACLHSIYYWGKASFPSESPWYAPYVEYALEQEIIDAPSADYDIPVTRAQFARMIAHALPESAFPAINTIADNAIPDVSVDDGFSGPVYRLYRAGVLNGCDSFGTFRPFGNLSRAEASAIVARTADMGFRAAITLPRELSGEEIYEKCAEAVFYLERFNESGDLIGIGSGFFITRDGLAVTNHHVIAGASAVLITTADGKKYNVTGVCGYDKNADLAILQVDGTDFSYLTLADSDRLDIGTPLYTIGSPLGLINTLSTGIVSSGVRDLEGSAFIQYSAPISSGSGGGPVLNTMGQVVGVSCLTIQNGQTLNFAVPSNLISKLSRTDCKPFALLLLNTEQSLAFYKNQYPVPDYGVFTGAPLYRSQYDETTGVETYYYEESAIPVGKDVAVYGYTKTLASYGFAWKSSYINDFGFTVDVYYNQDLDKSVHFGQDKLEGVVCWFVAIH